MNFPLHFGAQFAFKGKDQMRVFSQVVDSHAFDRLKQRVGDLNVIVSNYNSGPSATISTTCFMGDNFPGGDIYQQDGSISLPNLREALTDALLARLLEQQAREMNLKGPVYTYQHRNSVLDQNTDEPDLKKLGLLA